MLPDLPFRHTSIGSWQQCQLKMKRIHASSVWHSAKSAVSPMQPNIGAMWVGDTGVQRTHTYTTRGCFPRGRARAQNKESMCLVLVCPLLLPLARSACLSPDPARPTAKVLHSTDSPSTEPSWPFTCYGSVVITVSCTGDICKVLSKKHGAAPNRKPFHK